MFRPWNGYYEKRKLTTVCSPDVFSHVQFAGIEPGTVNFTVQSYVGLFCDDQHVFYIYNIRLFVVFPVS
jgi:hypothetical protein